MKAVKLTPLPTIKSAQVAPHADPVQDAKLPVGDAAAELEPELLQTAAAFEFDWAVTAKQLVVHFFLPFSIPLYTAVRGRRAARNQMLFLSAKTLVPSYLLPACFWVVALSMVARSEQLRQDGISLVEPLMSLVVTLFQRLVIAVKWGFLTPAERRKFYSAPDDATADRWHAETQLASGWLVPNGQLIKHELAKNGQGTSNNPERAQRLANCFVRLMHDVSLSLEPKNRDRFTQNLTVVRLDFQSRS